jgi:hypothetical protein
MEVATTWFWAYSQISTFFKKSQKEGMLCETWFLRGGSTFKFKTLQAHMGKQDSSVQTLLQTVF